MSPVKLYCDSLTVSLETGPDMKDITSKIAEIVGLSDILNGTLHASVVGSTGSITTIEYEPGVVQDLTDAINRMAPPGMDYAHEQAWRDGNGHSHVQAALIGPSIGIAIRNGSLCLGVWQQVVVINHDNKARARTIEVTVTGI